MDWLADTWKYIVGLLGAGVIGGVFKVFKPVIVKAGMKKAVKLLDKHLPETKIKAWCEPLAVGTTEFMVDKMGSEWNLLEEAIQKRLGWAIKYTNTGLDSDD